MKLTEEKLRRIIREEIQSDRDVLFEKRLKRIIRTEVQKLLHEGSYTATIGDGNNSTRWTPPGQERKLNVRSLVGYEQVDFPTAQNPVGEYPPETTGEELHIDQGVGAAYNNKIRAWRDDNGELRFGPPPAGEEEEVEPQEVDTF